MPGKLFLMYVLPFDGALAAFLFVLLGSWVAPQRRSIVALALFVVGCCIAWLLVGEFYSPQFSPDGPIRVWWPLIGTCSGGLLACVIACFLFRPAQVA